MSLSAGKWEDAFSFHASQLGPCHDPFSSVLS